MYRMKREAKMDNGDLDNNKTAKELLDWFSSRFLFTEKIKHGDIRLCFIVTETEYTKLREMSMYLNCIIPDVHRLQVVKH